MKQQEKNRLCRLSLDFSKGMYKDDIKRFFLPAKIILESVYCWPDNDAFYVNIIGWFIFINICVVTVCHGAYLFRGTTEISVIISVAATFNAFIETLVRFHILLTKKKLLNGILVKIWKNFWPTQAILKVEIRNTLRRRVVISFVLSIIFLITGTISTAEMATVPYLKEQQLEFRSIFPFDWNKNFVYETIYIYQYFISWYSFSMINTFDIFFVALVNVCTAQFVILQEVLKFILGQESKKQRKIIFGERGANMTDSEMLSQCLKQHVLLISICNDMETALNRAILMQFVVSATANCAGFLVMKIDYSQFSKMLFYAVAHLIQLFHYCYVGEHLSSESERIADVAYECSWQMESRLEFRKALILIMQRGQRKLCLTAVGLVELSFDSFVQILRTTFSFYTLLSTLLVTQN